RGTICVPSKMCRAVFGMMALCVRCGKRQPGKASGTCWASWITSPLDGVAGDAWRVRFFSRQAKTKILGVDPREVRAMACETAMESSSPPKQQSQPAMNGEILRRKVIVQDPLGLHMRPLTVFAQRA